MPNMVAERALPATISIHNALQMELGLQCKIGATIGEAYCGVVGGVKRHEYAVLGPSVNLAARLMASKMNPGILVDNRVRMMANRSYGFNALTPVVAKGYKDPVPIFEPLSPLERDWGKILPNFVGRKDEIMHIMQLARDMVLANNVAAKMVMIEGKSGMGKTATVAHAIEHIRKLMGANKHRLIITKNVGKESDSLVPFGVFRYIIRDVLKNFRASNDDKSYVSGTSCYTSLQQSIGWESLSGRSISQSTANLSTTAQSDVLKNLCRELDMPSSFIDHALSHLLGLKQEAKSKAKPPPPKIMISFLARAFKVCTQDARLVVLALDDLHHADDMSWKVIQQIFETAPNVLVIGTTYPTDNCKLNIDKAFFEELKTKHAGKRFVSQSMKPLTKEETTLMIMKTLGLQKKEVKADLLAGVTIQSGGMPHFVNEILEQVKRQMAIDEDFEISDMTYESFGDLVLQRVDDFDLNTRNMLNIGAVLGLSFTLDEVIAVQMKTSEGQEAAVRSATQDGLREAVKEGIVECKSIPSDEEEGRTVTKYSFYHAVWRTALLNLMLDGRKRDLHRTIAEVLEDKGKGTDEYMFQTRLFSHWVQSGNFVKASELALALGKHFEERLGLPAQSIKLYNDALSLRRENEDVSIGVAGKKCSYLFYSFSLSLSPT
jgi:Cdc6-like AAA superfamily ATPase